MPNLEAVSGYVTEREKLRDAASESEQIVIRWNMISAELLYELAVVSRFQFTALTISINKVSYQQRSMATNSSGEVIGVALSNL